jgi:hypothetical protein
MVDSWNKNQVEIKNTLAAVKTTEELTMVKDSFPELLKYNPFKKLLTDKFNEISK